MKGILGDLGEMKIPLNPDTNPVKQHLYRLKPRYMERVKDEFDRMLDTTIIEPVEESEGIRPMALQEKKTGEV